MQLILKMLLLHIFYYLRIFQRDRQKRSSLYLFFWLVWIVRESLSDWDRSLIYSSNWFHPDWVVKIEFISLPGRIGSLLHSRENEDRNQNLGSYSSKIYILSKCWLFRMMILYPFAILIRRVGYFILKVCSKWKKLLPLCLFSSI